MAAKKTANTIKSKKPVKKPAAPKKAPVVKPVVAEAKVRKPRKAKSDLGSSFEIMLKKQAELDAYKKQAKIDLKKKYDDKVKEAESLKAQYEKLFGEKLDAPAKVQKVKAKRAPAKGFTLSQVESYLEQLAAGGKIKIAGKNAKTVAKMKDAYDKAATKDAKSILELLTK